MEWSRVDQRFRIAVTGYPIKITGEIGETLDDYKRKHCGFSDQEAAGIRDVLGKFTLSFDQDRILVFKGKKSKNILLKNIPNYIIYNLSDRFEYLPSRHWSKISFVNLKSLSLSILPYDQSHLNNLGSHLTIYPLNKLTLDNVGNYHLYNDELAKLENVKIETKRIYNLYGNTNTYELKAQRVDSSPFISSLKPGLIKTLIIRYDTHINNEAFIKILTKLNLKTFTTDDVNLSHLTPNDIEEIFEQGITIYELLFLNRGFGQEVIIQFLHRLAHSKHHIKNFNLSGHNVNDYIVNEYIDNKIINKIKISGIRDFCLNGLDINQNTELFYKLKC